VLEAAAPSDRLYPLCKNLHVYVANASLRDNCGSANFSMFGRARSAISLRAAM
jgi:hypothetical protein